MAEEAIEEYFCKPFEAERKRRVSEMPLPSALAVASTSAPAHTKNASISHTGPDDLLETTAFYERVRRGPKSQVSQHHDHTPMLPTQYAHFRHNLTRPRESTCI